MAANDQNTVVQHGTKLRKIQSILRGLNSYSGFTGKYMRNELINAGFDVYGTVHYSSELIDANMYAVDLCDLYSLREITLKVMPDVVIHLAAKSSVEHDNVQELYQTNILGTRNLLQALSELKEKPSSILLASSANVYGKVLQKTITEAVHPEPVNDYGVSKLAMENMAKLWFDRLPIVIARPFNYTGVGQSEKFIIPKIVEHFRLGKKEIELGNIDVSRDFMDVRNVTKIYRMVLESGCSGNVVNICSGQALSIRNIIKTLSEIAGYEIIIKTNNTLKRQHEIDRLCGSNEYLMSILGEIETISIKDTLKAMYLL